jgi:ATP phosphoribosyltransferase regulatory subunit
MQTRLQLPQGASCFTFEDARKRRALEARVVEVFEGWGYDEIVPPLFDDEVTFDPSLSSRLYTFTGREGTTLALRPDFTSLVAKIAAGRLRQHKAPLRLYYSGEVVRYEPPRAGRQSEFHQMGLEFLGGAGPAADLEALAIAIECLEAVGVTDFVVAIGHAGVVGALLDNAGLPAPDPRRDLALAALNARDPLAVSHALTAAEVRGEARTALTTLAEDQGVRQSIEAARQAFQAGPAIQSGLDEIEVVQKALVQAGLGSRVTLDLSESRGLDYYTGLVFRIYAAGLGFEVGGGGRYDALLGRFGRPMPAVGFMLGLDRLALLVDRLGVGRGGPSREPAEPSGATLGEALESARALRARGTRIRFRGDPCA